MKQDIIDKNQGHVPECPCYTCCPGKGNFKVSLGDVLVSKSKSPTFGEKIRIVALCENPLGSERVLFVNKQNLQSHISILRFIKRCNYIFSEKDATFLRKYGDTKKWNGYLQEAILESYYVNSLDKWEEE